MLLILISAAVSKTTTVCNTADCVEETNGRTSFERGQLMKLWAKLSYFNETLGDIQPKWIRWYITVDELMIVEVNDSTCGFVNSNESNITFFAGPDIQNQDPKTTGETIYRSLDNQDYVVEYYSILIFLDKGVVTSVQFDTNFDTASCKVRNPKYDYWCPKKQTTDSCKEGSGSTIKTFVGFVGTDSKKVPLTSAQSMPSTFVKFGVGGVVDDATKFFNDAINWFK